MINFHFWPFKCFVFGLWKLANALLQISDVLYYMDNRAYVFRSYEVICDAAFEVIHSSKHGDKVKSETSRAISRVGFVLSRFCDGEFETFWKWYEKVWERFYEGTRKEKDLVYYIKIFQVLLTAKPHLQENVAKPLMDNLQEILEKTENHLLVPPLMSCLALISQQQPRLFEPRFQVSSSFMCLRFYFFFLASNCLT